MCHQSVGLVARRIEEAGIPTVVVANMRSPVLRLRPPRTLLNRGARGQTIGAPRDAEAHARIVRTALGMLETARAPGELVQVGP